MMLPNPQGVKEDEVRRFFREAQVTASLRHPNTVRVFDVGPGIYICIPLWAALLAWTVAVQMQGNPPV